MVPSFLIRVAKEAEYKVLTDLTYESKTYWNYPDEMMKAWKSKLNLSKDYIRQNIVYLSESEGELSGYFSIVQGNRLIKEEKIKDGYFIEHLYVKPSFIRKGIGTKLIKHALKICGKLGANKMFILADHNSKGFFEVVNGDFIEEVRSSVEDKPLYLYRLTI